jgi:hypothetical protein
MLTLDGRFKKKNSTASAMTTTPASRATHGQRLDGSVAPGGVEGGAL